MRWLSDRAMERLRAAAPPPDLSGTRYRLLSFIARGGMGAIWLAEDAALERRVALKVLDAPDASGDLAARLLREARILARLEHPGIVPVHDAGTLADGHAFYAMKYVEGRRLDQYLADGVSLPDRLRLFQKICEAVGFAHARGILHRDLKPENIMVGPFGEVLVMDWGVAKVLRDSSAARGETLAGKTSQLLAAAAIETETLHGAVLGTPGYMAPEQARGEVNRLDQRADVFALGALLRFLLTGRAPQPHAIDALASEDPSSAHRARPNRDAGGIARPLAAICAKAMAPEPAGRYPTVQDLTEDVARYLDGLSVSAYRENLYDRAARFYARHDTAILLVLAYLLMRMMLLFWRGR